MNTFLINRREAMQRVSGKKLGAFLVTHWADLFYLSGADMDESGGYWLVVTEDSIKAVTSPLFAGQLASSLDGIKILSGASSVKVLAGYLRKKGIRKAGFNPDQVNVSLFKRLKKEISAVSWTQLPDFFSSQRLVKSAEETAKIRESCRITARVFERLMAEGVAGKTEKEINGRIEYYFSLNSASTCFKPIVASGVNTAYPHHVSSDRRIKKDDAVMLDFGCRHNGYCSDYTRTVFLGKKDRKLLKMHDAVREAQEKAVESVKPGVPASAVDSVARGVLRKHGLEKYFVHTTGHGVGIEIHEQPAVSASCKTELKPGMVLTVEPGVYVPGTGGVRIEDTVLVTETGYEILTKTN